MSDPIQPRTPRPTEEESSGALPVLRLLFAAALLADAGLVAFPELIRVVNPGWNGDGNQVRLVAFAVLCVGLVITGVSGQRRRTQARRATIADFAASVGGKVEQVPYRVTDSGVQGGPRVAYRAAGWPVALSVERGTKSTYSFRLAADVVLRRDVRFLIVPGGKAMRFLMSKTFMLPVFSLAVKAATSVDDTSETDIEPSAAKALERIRYVGTDSITIGDESFDQNFVMKASDAASGRSFAGDPSVRAALTALRERVPGFQVTLESEAAGPARLVVGTTARDPGPEILGAMDAMLQAALGGLDRQELLERSARGAA